MRSGAPIRRTNAGRWIAGVLLASGIALAGRRAKALSDGGASGAILIGGTIFGRGGTSLGLPLIGFFVSSSVLSRLGKTRRPEIEAVTVKGGQRDLLQVLANGGIPAVISLTGGSLVPAPIAHAAVTGALAAVAADTWSTEIGGLSSTPPRSIVSGRVVPAGLSGGVTLLGLAGAAMGGALIGLLAGNADRSSEAKSRIRGVLRAAVVGLAGSLLDSLLGASLQRIYYCPVCETLTEQPVHTCGTTTEPRSGYAWMTNDTVNLLTSLSGAMLGVILIRREGER